MPPLLRIIDASANRAREGLRVLEDLARFGLDDADLSRRAKSLRHDLTSAISQALAEHHIDQSSLLAARDTTNDVGTTISTASEQSRPHQVSIAAAAAGRLTEALRSIEECLIGLGSPAAASRVEQARYHAYTLEKDLILRLTRPRRQWSLCVLITAELCPDQDWRRVARAALEGGADCLQLREKTLPHRELLTRARDLVTLASKFNASVIINDRADIAILAGAAGVHVGQDDLPAAEVRKLLPPHMLVGVSTSNLDQARQAVHDGADYCGVGPIFPSSTKLKPTLAGLDYLRAYLADPIASALPHLAISGIGPENAASLASLGCQGVAVSSSVCAAPDPAQACAAIRAALSRPHAAAPTR